MSASIMEERWPSEFHLPLGQDWLPPEVLHLAPRERELALIVYAHGAITAKDIQDKISSTLTNAAVRSMLVRLVNKGILARHWGPRRRSREFLYLPAIGPAEGGWRALKQVAELHFEGCMLSVALAALTLLSREGVPVGQEQRERSIGSLSRFAPVPEVRH